MPRVTSIDVGKHQAVVDAISYDRPQGALKQLLKEHEDKTEGEPPDDKETEKEEALRCLIEAFPLVLPWEDWTPKAVDDPAGLKVVVVMRTLRGKATDLVLLERWPDGDARFVIVETKLRRNAEIHRAVIGQVLEYGAALAAEAVEAGGPKLLGRAEAYWRSKGGWEKVAAASFGDSWRQEVWAPACHRASQGDIRLLIVADRIPLDLRQALTFLPASVLLAAAEVEVYEPGKKHIVVAAGVGATGTPNIRETWEKWVGRVSLSAVELNALSDGAKIQTAAATHDQKVQSNPRTRVDVEGIIEASKPAWRPILKTLVGLLRDGECGKLLWEEEKSTSVSFRAEIPGGKRATLIRIKPDQVAFSSYYFRPKGGERPRRGQDAYGDRLVPVAEEYGSRLQSILGAGIAETLRTTIFAKVKDPDALNDDEKLRRIAEAVCVTAWNLGAARP